ncbi:ComEC/Rec2 family competence protein [Paenibacillus donghaensis]|uniref:Metallo-beta-lactamase domain-containing protein n=1 Tax=Paenibacillus donghaensis TaxID=414771 RepID=A0A2Z2KHT9_9BACL|nr:ComEC/Rec2 family competence protein [Paenibacillus donghaensis]ASA23655.1 hypothetical protein B9T62_24395 [Paenibacillus donghaensis]
MRERLLLSFTVCWVCGSTAACLYSGGRLALAAAGVLLLLAAAAAWAGLGWRYTAVLGMAVIAACLYWEWSEGRNISSLPEALGRSSALLNEMPVRAEGSIVSTVERDGDRVDFIVKLSGIALLGNSGNAADIHPTASSQQEEAGEGGNMTSLDGEKLTVQLKLQAESEIDIAGQWQRGDRVALSGAVELPGEARNFGGFDYRAYLATQHMHWLLKLDGTASAEVTPPEGWSPAMLLRWTDQARSAMGAKLGQLFQPRHSGYMKGLIIGFQDDLDPDIFQQFSQLGLTHILAISGMHVAVYVGALLFIWKRCRLTRETALTLTLLLVPVYVLLSGAGPSVVRAGLMSMIALYAARVQVLGDGRNILSAAALAMLLWNPYLLLSVSFQLSFLVTAGLMVYVPMVNLLLRKLPLMLRSAVSVTVVAQLVSFPLTIYYFNQFSLLSFAANLLLVPFITFVVLPLGTLTLLLSACWEGAAGKVADAAELLNNWTFVLVEWMNGFPGAVLIWRSPSLLWICGYYLLLYGLLAVARLRIEARNVPQYMEDETRPLDGSQWAENGQMRAGINGHGELRKAATGWRGKVLQLAPAAALAVLLCQGYRSEELNGAGHISYLDVGQGDSILITTPDGANILVDGGGTVSFGAKEPWRIRRSPFEVGAKTLVPLLKKRGIHRLDAVVLTHADQDHAGGLQAVLESIPVSALLFNGTLTDREPYRKLMRTALAANIKLYSVHQGMTLRPDSATELAVLWPPPPLQNQPQADYDVEKIPVLEEQNHGSVVFRLELNGRNFLFTGDMDEEAEEEIIQSAALSGISQAPRADVLKVAHHGSKTSTGEAWLEFWRPAAAVISAGVNNSYGHPNGGVLDRLAAGHTAVFRTDLQGEIQLNISKGELTVRSKLGAAPAPAAVDLLVDNLVN